jgi:diphosphomevalonate decarboxylase
MAATAKANANIALVKYWGKRDSELNLPMNSSISITLDKLSTTTTVELNPVLTHDIVILDNLVLETSSIQYKRISKHLDLFRNKTSHKAKVTTSNNFPTGSGLASSSSGFAALTIAAAKAYNLRLDKKTLSIIARQGSGSASRSIHGGFVEWHKGTKDDGSDSFAAQIEPASHWPELSVLVCIVDQKSKTVSSRVGMEQTVKTSPFYQSWLDTIETDLQNMRDSIKNKDFELLGKTAEHNCLKMHGTMQTTNPPIIYWKPTTIVIMQCVHRLRATGIQCYFTMDAGPQVKVLCLETNKKAVHEQLQLMDGIQIISCKIS